MKKPRTPCLSAACVLRSRNLLLFSAIPPSEAVTLQPENTDYLIAASRMAFALEDYEYAEAGLVKVLSTYRGTAVGDGTKPLVVLDNLANLYRIQGKTGAAKSALNEALAVKTALYGENHPMVIHGLYRLAELDLVSANYGEASHHLRRAVDILDASQSPIEDQDGAALLHNMGIQSRLFLAYSGVIMLVVLAMMIAVSWSFQRGLGDYLHKIERERLDKIASTLANAYGEAGDWSFLRHDEPAWTRLLDQALGQSSTGQVPNPASRHPPPSPSVPLRPGPPPPRHDDERIPPSHRPPVRPAPPPFPGPIAAAPPDAEGISRPPRPGKPDRAMPLRGTGDFRLRLRLLDENDHPVFGPREVDGAETRRDIVWQDQVVGYLVLRKSSEIVDELAEGFELDQRRTYIPIMLLGLLLAMGTSMVLARRLLKPVHQLAAGGANRNSDTVPVLA